MQERLTERDGKIEIPNYPFGTDPYKRCSFQAARPSARDLSPKSPINLETSNRSSNACFAVVDEMNILECSHRCNTHTRMTSLRARRKM